MGEAVGGGKGRGHLLLMLLVLVLVLVLLRRATCCGWQGGQCGGRIKRRTGSAAGAAGCEGDRASQDARGGRRGGRGRHGARGDLVLRAPPQLARRHRCERGYQSARCRPGWR